MRRVFSLLVDNRFGELPRVVGLCSGRGFRIEGVTAVESDGGETMRIDVVTDCDEAAAERLRKLLASQVRVLEAVTLAADRSAEREVALIEVEAEGDTVRLRLGEHLGVRAHCEASPGGGTAVEALGRPEAIAALADDLATLGPCEVVRSGPFALRRPSFRRSH